MASDDLIAAYLSDLGQRLPSGVVAELSDGLIESYEHMCQRGFDDAESAALAVRDFGDADQVVAEFVQHSPGRRTANQLLRAGPAVGLVWGASLVTMRAWNWPVPLLARLGFASILACVIVALASARTAATWRRANIAAYGAIGLIALDAVIISVALTMAPTIPWIASVAIVFSLFRSSFAIRSIPRILVR